MVKADGKWWSVVVSGGKWRLMQTSSGKEIHSVTVLNDGED
jgi:hypothetical protein